MATVTTYGYPRVPLQRGLTNNATGTAYPAALSAVTATKPATVDDSGTPTSNAVVIPSDYAWTFLAFLLVGADNVTAKARIIGWKSALLKPSNYTTAGIAQTPIWIPFLLGEYTLTASGVVGISGNPIAVNTERFADTIAAVSGSNARILVSSQVTVGDNLGAASLLVPNDGYDLIHVGLITNGSATSMNVLFGPG